MSKIILPLDEVWKLHNDQVDFFESYTEKDFDVEWRIVRDNLRQALKSRWRESCYGDEDFALSDDRTNNWAQAGGIFNEAMLSKHFSKIIFDVFANVPHSERWGVLFSVNVAVFGKGQAKLKGEILLKNSAIYIAEYKRYNSESLFAML